MLINSKHTDLKAFEHQVVPCHPMYREKDSARGLLNQVSTGDRRVKRELGNRRGNRSTGLLCWSEGPQGEWNY